jgi:hypothetical protein
VRVLAMLMLGLSVDGALGNGSGSERMCSISENRKGKLSLMTCSTYLNL